MPSRPSRHACAIAGTLALITTLAATTPEARAGEFQVAACQADQLGFTTRPFEDFATRGMEIRRACNPEGRGLRGLITANVIRRGRVPRGARAIVAINAPAGTRFTTLALGGHAAPPRLPVRAAAVRRRARHRADRDQERARQPRLSARAARAGGAVRAAHLQRHRRHPDRAARDLRRRRRQALLLSARKELHPHLQSNGRDRRHAPARRRSPPGHAARPRRMGPRHPAPELRRQRQRGRPARHGADRRGQQRIA